MKIKFTTLFFVIASLLSFTAYAVDDRDADRSHPGTYAKDASITTKIKSKLAAENLSSLAKIRVDTDNQGVVVLSGKAKSQEDADKAVSIASATEGVTSVKNKIKIKKDD